MIFGISDLRTGSVSYGCYRSRAERAWPRANYVFRKTSRTGKRGIETMTNVIENLDRGFCAEKARQRNVCAESEHSKCAVRAFVHGGVAAQRFQTVSVRRERPTIVSRSDATRRVIVPPHPTRAAAPVNRTECLRVVRRTSDESDSDAFRPVSGARGWRATR